MERLKAMEIFKAVVDHGSFTKAADATHVGVPSVSRAVQDLEALLGVQLFNRTTRKVKLTSAGHAVLEHVTGVLDCYDDLARVSSDVALDVAGDIRIEVPAMFGVQRIAPVVGRFMREYPKVRVDIRLVDSQAETLGDLADLAIIVGRTPASTCVARPLAATRLGLYANRDFLRANAKLADPNDLDPEQCMAVMNKLQQSAWPMRHAGTGESVTLLARSPVRTNCPSALIAAAIEGLGAAIVPEHLASIAVARADLVPVLGDWQPVPLDTYLLYRQRRNQPLRVRRLVEQIVDALGADSASPAAPAHVPSGAQTLRLLQAA